LLPMLAMPSLPFSTGGRFTDKLHRLSPACIHPTPAPWPAFWPHSSARAVA
jgi:hypothetical protein